MNTQSDPTSVRARRRAWRSRGASANELAGIALVSAQHRAYVGRQVGLVIALGYGVILFAFVSFGVWLQLQGVVSDFIEPDSNTFEELVTAAEFLLALGLLAFLYLLPAFIAVPCLLPAVWAWRRPARILVLRRFGRRDTSRALRRIVRSDVAGYGHVYTLADPQIRVRWFVRVPIFLGQLGLLSFRRRRIRRQRQVGRLMRYVKRTRIRNLNWYLSQRKMWPIRCSDRVWMDCAAAMISTAHLIVVDVSEVTDHVLWELEQCRTRGLLDSVMFLARRDRETAARDVLAQHLDSAGGLRLFVYDDRGIVDRDAFLKHVALILAPVVQPKLPLVSGPRRRWMANHAMAHPRYVRSSNASPADGGRPSV